MRRPALLAMLSLGLSACAAPQAEVVEPPRLVAVTPPAPVPEPIEPLLQRCLDRVAKARKDRDAIVELGRKVPIALAPVLAQFNDLSIQADNADNESSLMRAVHPDAKVRDAASECEKLVAALRTELSLDRGLYDVFAQVRIEGQPADVLRLVSKTLEDFQRAGVDKDEPTRARIKALNDELVTVGQDFDKSIAGDVRSVELDPGQLLGLPQDWIDAHKPCSKDDAAAKKCTEGKVRVTTNYPDAIPFMSYARDDAARKALYLVTKQRAWPENDTNLVKMLRLRHELATLLGFKDWAAFIVGNKMIRTEQAVGDFIERISKASDARMKRERNALLAELRKTDKGATAVQDWQTSYLLGVVKKDRYAFDAQALRPYLHYDKVKNGLLALTSKLFGVQYRPNLTAPKWHPDIEAYDVYEGEHLFGTIYLDMHPRENKFKHAAQFSLQNGLEGKQLPIGVLVCNFPNPRTGNGLMEHKDVETFFHEFGHLLHHVIGGHQKWQRFSGVATEWDFVEAPSQIFEEWAKDYDVLKAFATDDKGVVVPKELVEKLRASDDFGKALWVRHQMFYAALSLRLHDRDPSGIDMDKLVAELMARYSPYPFVPETHMQASFGHLNGYSAMYYTYMWSLVIAKDMFSKFKAQGILDPATALAYRKAVLQPGGSKDAAQLVADFLGRPYTYQAFEDWLNQRK
jgi:thimet oligopeptidase